MGVKTRKHHNNKGYKMVKNGTTAKQVKKMAERALGNAQKRLFTLFISYRFGSHYCGAYPTLEYLYDVVLEMVAGEVKKKDIPLLQEIRERLENHDDYWHEFSNGTWIHIQETSEHLVRIIQEHWKPKEYA